MLHSASLPGVRINHHSISSGAGLLPDTSCRPSSEVGVGVPTMLGARDAISARPSPCTKTEIGKAILSQMNESLSGKMMVGISPAHACFSYKLAEERESLHDRSQVAQLVFAFQRQSKVVVDTRVVVRAIRADLKGSAGQVGGEVPGYVRVVLPKHLRPIEPDVTGVPSVVDGKSFVVAEDIIEFDLVPGGVRRCVTQPDVEWKLGTMESLEHRLVVVVRFELAFEIGRPRALVEPLVRLILKTEFVPHLIEVMEDLVLEPLREVGLSLLRIVGAQPQVPGNPDEPSVVGDEARAAVRTTSHATCDEPGVLEVRVLLGNVRGVDDPPPVGGFDFGFRDDWRTARCSSTSPQS